MNKKLDSEKVAPFSILPPAVTYPPARVIHSSAPFIDENGDLVSYSAGGFMVESSSTIDFGELDSPLVRVKWYLFRG